MANTLSCQPTIGVPPRMYYFNFAEVEIETNTDKSFPTQYLFAYKCKVHVLVMTSWITDLSEGERAKTSI